MYKQKSYARGPGRVYGRNSKLGYGRAGSRFKKSPARFTRGAGRHKSAKLDISAFINKNAPPIAPEEMFVPAHTFGDFNLRAPFLTAIREKGYTKPTPIQDKIIPSILEGKDVVGLANTGTGKTAAFLIPLIDKVMRNPREQVLVVAPTRELALQIKQELDSLTPRVRMYSVACVGGENIGSQMRKLRHMNHFIIGTPGRLIDLVQRGTLKLDGVGTVVLDEADRMLDMGFVKDIRFLMAHVPKQRQTLCFSATISKTIDALIQDFLKAPATISVKTKEIPEHIEQDIVRVRGADKVAMLHNLLGQNDFKKVLVFGRTKRGVENLSRTLSRKGIKAESIHSDKSQAQRERALWNFKQNRVQALVATDVAARGLDIDSVTHVINFDTPETYDDYIHRIGRTGRGASRGKALTFVD